MKWIHVVQVGVVLFVSIGTLLFIGALWELTL